MPVGLVERDMNSEVDKDYTCLASDLSAAVAMTVCEAFSG